MARLIETPIFDPQKPLVAVRSFTSGGHRFKPGNAFPWKRLSVSQRRVRQMFELRLVRHIEGTLQPKEIMPLGEGATHEFLSDLSGRVGTDQTLTTKTFTDGQFDSDNPSWTSVTGATVEAVVLYIDTGVAGTSHLVAYIDTGQTGLPVTPNGGDINLTVDAANGWFTL